MHKRFVDSLYKELTDLVDYIMDNPNLPMQEAEELQVRITQLAAWIKEER